MTTFVAIILGQAVAGVLRSAAGADLGASSLLFVALAVLGTWTASRILPVRAAQPSARIRWPAGDLMESLRGMARDRDFRGVVLANSYFWFLGAVMQPMVNVYGVRLMKLDDARTSMLLVALSAGMAGGAVLGGRLARGRVDFRHCLWGAIGAAVVLAVLVVAHASYASALAAYLALGVAGSLFGLPLQTYIQKRAAADRKGRDVAAAGFANWVLICLSAVYFHAAATCLPIAWIGVPLAPLTVVVAIALRRRMKFG
jgi:Na+/melibiose symporter-like transporter